MPTFYIEQYDFDEIQLYFATMGLQVKLNQLIFINPSFNAIKWDPQAF